MGFGTCIGPSLGHKLYFTLACCWTKSGSVHDTGQKTGGTLAHTLWQMILHLV